MPKRNTTNAQVNQRSTNSHTEKQNLRTGHHDVRGVEATKEPIESVPTMEKTLFAKTSNRNRIQTYALALRRT